MAIDFHDDPRSIELQLVVERAKYERWLAGELEVVLRTAFARITDTILSSGLTGLSDYERSRLLRLYAEIERLLHDAYGTVTSDLTSQMQQLATLEADLVHARLSVAVSVPGITSTVLTSALDGVLARTFANAVAAFPVRGLTIGEWFEQQAVKMSFATKSTIQQGLIDGLSPSAIARQVVPSVTSADPAVQRIALRDMTAIVRTTHTAVSNSAAIESYVAAGPTVSDRYRWSAVRDARTTPICRALDGKVFRYSDPKAPIPPAHVGCRSTIVALLTDAMAQALGRDPTQPAHGWSDYSAWLKDQSQTAQNDILGPTRAQWWRDGRMSLEQAVDADTRTLTLAQLRTKLGLDASPETRHLVVQ